MELLSHFSQELRTHYFVLKFNAFCEKKCGKGKIVCPFQGIFFVSFSSSVCAQSGEKKNESQLLLGKKVILVPMKFFLLFFSSWPQVSRKAFSSYSNSHTFFLAQKGFVMNTGGTRGNAGTGKKWTEERISYQTISLYLFRIFIFLTLLLDLDLLLDTQWLTMIVEQWLYFSSSPYKFIW